MKKNIETIVNSVGQVIFKTNLDGKLIFINKYWEGLMGYKIQESLGESLEIYIVNSRKEKVKKVFEQLQNGVITNNIFKSKIKGKNSEKWIIIDVHLQKDENGDAVEITGTIQDITISEKARIRIDELSKAMESSADGFAIIDTNGRYDYLNEAYASIFGYNKPDLIGQMWNLQYTNETRVIFEEEVFLNLKKSDYWRGEAYGIKKDGTLVSQDLTFTLLENNKIAINCRDNTERKSSELKLRDYAENLEKTNLELKSVQKNLSLETAKAIRAANAKSEFLSNMSHEIRTPMNAILGLTDILVKSNNFKGQHLENLTAVKKSSEHLLIIINDILDLSKIESGKLTFEDIDFSIHDKVNELYKVLQFRAKEKNIVLNTFVDNKVPKYVVGDPYRLMQILLNVVGNAIKFTNYGEVNLKVEYIGNNKIKFIIADTGIGIPKEKMDVIFEVFEQIKGSMHNSMGTGLGLAITRNLVILQKGDIHLDSEMNKGTTVTIQIPYLPSELSELKETKQQKAAINLDGINILVAEDNAINQMLIKQVLEGWKCKYTIVDNGQKALDALEKEGESFDVILMDLQMPIMNGFKATQMIREEQNMNIPIIALTADIFPETKQKVMTSGFNYYLTKPFKLEKLLEAINEAKNDVS